MATNRRFKASLRWSTPSRLLPHGWSGIAMIVTGALLLCRTIFGNSLDLYDGPLPFLYTFFTMVNAVAGYRLARVAPSATQHAFRSSAIFQLCLSYYVTRFLPSFQHYLASWLAPLVRVLDVGVVLAIFKVLVDLIIIAYDQLGQDPPMAIAISCGTMGLALTILYPMQLAIQHDWLACVVKERYPAQDVAMVAYIYLPTTFSFGLCIFGATLFVRKIISNVQLCLFCVASTVGTLLLTVLLQEIQVPSVSTQDLYMACPLPENQDSWQWKLEQATSPRPILSSMLRSPISQTVFGWLGSHRIETYDSK